MRRLLAVATGAVLAVGPLGPGPARAVVGGQEAAPHQYPFMAGLVDLDQRRVMCGGALVAERYVLTAAHCLTGSYADTRRVGVLLGDHDLTVRDDSPDAVLASPERFLVHPGYDPATQRNDLALVRLDRPVAYGRSVGPVGLPSSSYASLDHARVEAPGWGATSYGGAASEVLRVVALDTMGTAACVARGMTGVTAQQLCTYSPGRDTCLYDSGGPLVHRVAGRPYVVGLVSYGKGCATDSPAVNTRVGAYLSWIGRTIGTAA